jgi:uncharacterized protein YbaR (Trm112 family)
MSNIKQGLYSDSGGVVVPEVSKRLLDILVCPKCRAKIVQQENGLRCTNTACNLVFPAENGIPVMLIERAARQER